MNQQIEEKEIDLEAIEELKDIKCIFYGMIFGIWIMCIIILIIL